METRESSLRYYYTSANLIFVGINPHPGSAKRGVPFSNNKSFWYHLAQAGLINETKENLKKDEYLYKLYHQQFEKEYGLGLINMVDRPTVTISDLKKGEEIFGRRRLYNIIAQHKPLLVCFVGKSPYEKFINHKVEKYGRQEDIGGSKIYVKHDPLRGYASIRVNELLEINCKRQELLMQRSQASSKLGKNI